MSPQYPRITQLVLSCFFLPAAYEARVRLGHVYVLNLC